MSEPSPLEVLRSMSDLVQSAIEQLEQHKAVLTETLDRETEECAALVQGYLTASQNSGVAYDIPLALRVRIEERKLSGPIVALA